MLSPEALLGMGNKANTKKHRGSTILTAVKEEGLLVTGKRTLPGKNSNKYRP